MKVTSKRCFFFSLLLAIVFPLSSTAATKPHVITFGKWISVQWTPGTGDDDSPVSIKVRSLLVDGRVKEYTMGPSHDITERTFVVRRALRVNDSLPNDPAPRWQWQRAGWMIVDRVTGRVSAANLPEFDVMYSAASWYRDYVAYCGVSDDGHKTFAMVAQLNRREPVLKEGLSEGIADNAPPDSACPAPTWERSPTRVSFETKGGAKQTFAIRGHVVDVVTDAEEEE